MLIGREAELGRVERALEGARGGGSDMLVLRGQPGIGKTALLLAAIERAEGMTVLRARGDWWRRRGTCCRRATPRSASRGSGRPSACAG